MQPKVDSDDEDAGSSPSVPRPEVDSENFNIENSEAEKYQPSGPTERITKKVSASPGGAGDMRLTQDESQGAGVSSTNGKKLLALEDLDLKQVIKDEVTAALKRNADEVDEEVQKRIEEEMRSRLAQFGFQPNQIEAVVHPEKAKTLQPGMAPNSPPWLTHQPTYVKVHKDHLPVYTLIYYDIPYEIDRSDSDYMIILRELEPRETEILFEHTRRLRSRGASYLAVKERDRTPKPDYAQVRRRPERTQSPNTNRRATNHYKTNHVEVSPRSRTTTLSRDQSMTTDKVAAARRKQKSSKTSSKRGTSPLPTIAEPNVNLRVPPFLVWPNTLGEVEDDASKDRSNARPQSSGEHDSALTELTLSEIEKYMRKNRQDDADLPVSFHHPFHTSYKSGKAFVEIPEKSIKDLEPVQDAKSFNNPQWNQGVLDVRNELAFVETIREGTGRASKSCTTPLPKISSTASLKQKSVTRIPSRRAIQWQMSRLLIEMDLLISSTQQLIDQFVPKHYPHPLLRKCWGTLYEISKVSLLPPNLSVVPTQCLRCIILTLLTRTR